MALNIIKLYKHYLRNITMTTLNERLFNECKNHTKAYMVEIIQLIRKGADINAVSNDPCKNSPLMVAIKYNSNIYLIELLIDLGANVNYRNVLGETPLIWACGGLRDIKINIDIISLLLNNNARIHDRVWRSWPPNLPFKNHLIISNIDNRISNWNTRISALDVIIIRLINNDPYDKMLYYLYKKVYTLLIKHSSAIFIQKYIRGWLYRHPNCKTMKRLIPLHAARFAQLYSPLTTDEIHILHCKHKHYINS